ncbi:hypothetical protein G9444_2441 [Rhodococcus erythropolis]|uniref:Uncharacterized protein n=1 Tax=Rhodococcus erythropolis TaxID=1833 RepID=A0A6G9CRL2_RHOER|nr:hypothetical protein [Rhodococcus erythropolis]QIP39685.1 hypothetical protein G9444_2441 [Rhodococcus erythropolis]
MSSYGEDIIRETFEKLGDAIGVQMQMQMPDALIANLGAVLQAQIDLLAELQSAGRLIPDGGMALTAEEVEDVEALVATANPYSAPADRLRALFPAAEHAEEPREIGWFRTMTPEFATKHFGFPGVMIGSKGFWTHTASDGGKWAWDGDDWELREYPPAPAEPAKEETKAERCWAVSPTGCRCTRRVGHKGYHANRIGGILSACWPASSPVVPAPTETGPWQRIEDVPESVYLIKDCEGDKWRRDRKSWEVYSERGFRWHPGFPDRFAPFVAAEEG